jgi:tetratricopeptide (TPR) repeat protein
VAGEALQIAAKIINPDRRAEVLADMADTLVAHHLIDQAAQAVEDAWQTFHSIDDQESQGHVCDVVSKAAAGLARALIAAGRWDEAERQTRSIALLNEQAVTLAILAEGLVNAGQLVRARRVIRNAWRIAAALGPWGKAKALAVLARSLAAAGDAGRAQRAARAAERAAASNTDPRLRAEALAIVAAALAAVGELGRSEQAAQDAEQAASIAGPDFYSWAGLVRALADDGRFDSAERVVTKITGSDERADALVALVRALADAGRFESAERVAATIIDPEKCAQALALLVRALASAGVLDQAERVAANAERAVDGLQGWKQGDVLGAVALALAGAGRLDSAERAAAKMCDAFKNGWKEGLQVDVVRVLADAGGFDSAERVAANITSSHERLHALVAVVRALIDAGQFDSAEWVAAKIPKPDKRWQALAKVASALADAGELPRAAATAAMVERSARGNLNYRWLAPKLAVLADALSAAGLLDVAGQVAANAEQAADISPDWTRNQALGMRNEALEALARALADAGQFDFAERAAAKITDSYKRAYVLAALVSSQASAGVLDRAGRVIGEAVRAAVDTPYDPAWVIASLVQDLVNAGMLDQAEQVAWEAEMAAEISPERNWDSTFEKLTSRLADAGRFNSAERVAEKISSSEKRAQALTVLAGALGGAGLLGRAEEIAGAAEQAAAYITEIPRRAAILCDLVQTLGGAGLLGRAEEIAGAAEQAAAYITEIPRRAAILCDLVQTLGGAGLLDRAEEIATGSAPIADMLMEPRQRVDYLAHRARSLGELARAMVEVGLADRAERVAAGAEQAMNEALIVSQEGDTGTAMAPSNEKGLARQVDVLIRAGQLDQAQRAARAITPTEETSPIFSDLFGKFAAAGEFEKAEYFGRRVRYHDPEQLAQVLTDLTGRLASAGEFDWAERVVQTIMVPFWQAHAWGKIVAALAAVGAMDQADRVARCAERATEKIINPEHQSPALTQIIKNCKQKDQQSWVQSAYHLCGLVLTRPYWPDILPIMCQLDLPSLIAAITAIQSQNRE